MLKNMLTAIKEDLKNVRSNRGFVQDEIKRKTREIEAGRKAELAENARTFDNPESLDFWTRKTNETFNSQLTKAISDIFARYHEDQSYHIIYKDGSEVCVTAEEILGGEPFPKLTGIVYAELSSGWENYDTETGNLDFYSEKAMEACDGDYDTEDERRWQYDAAIEIKYGTEWGTRWMWNHPDFVPVAL